MSDAAIMFRTAILTCALLVPLLGVAQERKSTLKPLTFTEYDLPNGLHVILHENHLSPVVSTYLLYHVGSKDERSDRTGFAHFFEHLMFEGSDNIPRKTIDKYISGAGGILNASTSFDRTDYFFNLPSNQLKMALWIESERMLHNRIDQVGVDTQREVVKEERRMRYDNRPYGSQFEKLCELAFQGTSYAWTPIGSTQYIDKATIDEFRAFWKQYYLPNNATLAIAGDFKSEEVKKLVEEYFGGIPKGTEPPRPKIELTKPKGIQKIVVTEDKTPLPSSLRAWPACSQTDPDSYALDLLSNIMATGRSSRLYRRLVNQDQIALNTDTSAVLFEKGGLMIVSATGQQPGVKLELLDKVLEEEVEKIRSGGVTEEEFAKALAQKEAEIANNNGSMMARARNLANFHLFHGKTEEVNRELDRYYAVKREDLQRVAKKYFDPENAFVIHYAVPPPKLDPTPSAPKEGAGESAPKPAPDAKAAPAPKAK